MDLSAESLFASVVVSSIGFALFVYGKKQQRLPQLAGGLVMMIYPYVVTGALPMLAIFVGIVGAIWLAVKQGW